MELSKRRAETIVTTLKENLKGFKLNYTPIGIGETDKYAPGKKWPEFKQEATAPNRRLIIKIQTIQDYGIFGYLVFIRTWKRWSRI